MDVRVQVLLDFVEAAAASEDDTGAPQKRGFGITNTGWSTGKIRQFIHAVVNDRRRIQMTAETERHRRVVPQHFGPDVLTRDHVVQKTSLNILIVSPIRLAQMRHDDVDVWVCVSDRRMRRLIRVEHRFFDDEDSPVAGATAQQMLWTLEHEVPSQV